MEGFKSIPKLALLRPIGFMEKKLLKLKQLQFEKSFLDGSLSCLRTVKAPRGFVYVHLLQMLQVTFEELLPAIRKSGKNTMGMDGQDSGQYSFHRSNTNISTG